MYNLLGLLLVEGYLVFIFDEGYYSFNELLKKMVLVIIFMLKVLFYFRFKFVLG